MRKPHELECAVCHKACTSKCAGCKTFYCSAEHQRMDWPRHKLSFAHNPTVQTKKSELLSSGEFQAAIQHIANNQGWLCGAAAKEIEEHMKPGGSEFI